MASVTPKPQTTATCQSPIWALVSTGAATEPVPNSTSRYMPRSSRQGLGATRRARSYALQGVEPGPYAALDLGQDRAKGAQAFHCGPFGLGGIVKRPMDSLERERKQARTAVLGLVAHDDGIGDTDLAKKSSRLLAYSPLGSRPMSVSTWRVSACTSVGATPALSTSKRSPA
jgi:hypothetical protein